MAYINRDPFARQEMHRETVPGRANWANCAWCGGLNAHGKLYRYRIETDGGRVWPDDKVFCSIGCRRIYYQIP